MLILDVYDDFWNNSFLYNISRMMIMFIIVAIIVGIVDIIYLFTLKKRIYYGKIYPKSQRIRKIFNSFLIASMLTFMVIHLTKLIDEQFSTLYDYALPSVSILGMAVSIYLIFTSLVYQGRELTWEPSAKKRVVLACIFTILLLIFIIMYIILKSKSEIF